MNAALNRLMLAVSIAEDVLAELDNRTAVVRMPAVKNPAPERAHEAGSSLVSCIHDVSSRIESIHQRIRNITSELEI